MNKNMCMRNSIDRLPDELLVSIVSRLPLIDAARTSTLSHKWRYYWTYRPVLDFNLSLVEYKYREQSSPIPLHYILHTEREWFENLVDSVLNLHSGTTIEKFRILFDMHSSSSKNIDRWLEFAFTKRVERLDIDLMVKDMGFLGTSYEIPNICDPIERLRIFPNGISRSCESLVSLRLTDVGVTGEVLETLISNCPLLEELYVECSSSLRSLITSHPLLRLRRLEIQYCSEFTTLEICSPNLISLTLLQHSEKTFSLCLMNVSSLANLSLETQAFKDFPSQLVQISGCLSRLETLTMTTQLDHEVRHPLPKFPNLPRLKKLVFNVHGDIDVSLLCFAPLIDAAPMLRKFVLKVELYSNLVLLRARQTIVPVKGQRHECLEVFNIVGFVGSNVDLDLAEYVIEHAVSLKKVIIDCRQPHVQPYREAEALQNEKTARERISLIQSKLAEGVQLIVH